MSKVINKLFYLYLLLKPYYIFKSGGIQPCDIVLILAFAFLLISKKESLNYINKNRKFLLFTIMVFIINSLYFIVYEQSKYMLSTLYYIFNLIAIIIFTKVFEDEKNLIETKKIMIANLIVQLVIFIVGIGRYYGTMRYMGTFNDPNQFSYYVLLSLTYIFVIDEKIKCDSKEFIPIIITVFLIFLSASTGMTLGLLLLIFSRIIYKMNKSMKYKIIVVFFIMFFGIFLVIFSSDIKNYIKKYDDNFLVSRIVDKLDRVDSTKSSSKPTLLQERGYDKIIKYPYYLIIGAGEGYYERFDGFNNIEIHATFPSILFYYGVIPFLVLISWIYDRLKSSKLSNLIYLFPLFVESFTLLNQRQTLFWGIILLYSFLDKKGNKNVINTKIRKVEANCDD